MGQPQRRYINLDQQPPPDDIEEPSRATVSQTEFTRMPPTAEDDYFFEQERKRYLTLSKEIEVRGKAPPRPSVEQPPPQPVDRPGSIWQKIYRVFSKRFNLNWRP